MFRHSALIAAFLALAATLGPAAGQSLRDLRAQDADEEALVREAAYTSAVCGRTISARIDWPSARRWPADASLAEACDGSLGAVEAACRAGRRNLVKQFVCAGDGTGPGLSGAALRYGARPGVNGYAETMSYLDGIN